jgi:hypothetical protein
MEKESVTYKGFVIWAVQLRGSKWGATLARLPSKGAMATAGPNEGEAVPSEFDSKKAAIEAGKEYVDRRHGQ